MITTLLPLPIVCLDPTKSWVDVILAVALPGAALPLQPAQIRIASAQCICMHLRTHALLWRVCVCKCVNVPVRMCACTCRCRAEPMQRSHVTIWIGA